MPESSYALHKRESYRYVDEGQPSSFPPIVLLHGMLGDLSNWTETIGDVSAKGYRVLVPVLPVYDLPLGQTSVSGLVDYVYEFLEMLEIDRAVLVGNSLGGQVALKFAIRYPEQVAGMILSGASGIYEVAVGNSVPRRKDREFIRDRAAYTFYDPAHATDELVDEMFEIINDRTRVIRLIKMARSTKAESVVDHLSSISAPTLLVWGRDDAITPPDVAEEFARRLPNAQLRFIERCGHAPMIEHPKRFNRYMLDFLAEAIGSPEFVSSSRVI